MNNIRISAVIFFIYTAISILPVFSQENNIKPRIAVKALDVSDPDNMQLKIISNRVTGNTKLLLKFMNEYELDSAAALSGIEETSMLDYCNSNNIDNIVYGKTYIGSDDSFIIEMSVYSREKQQTALTRIGRAETALDIFEASDNLTASIIEEFSGVHIAFGKIQLTNTGVPGSYIPYIDGEPFPKDAASIENLLIGKRTVEIRQMRMLGEYTVYSQDLLVKENAAAELSFEIPHLLPAESEVINDYEKIISKNWDKLKRKEKVTRAFNELDSIFTNQDYNLSLLDLKEEYRIRRAEYEANLIELGKRGKREFIVGAAVGGVIGNVSTKEQDDGKTGSPDDPIDTAKWNDDIKITSVSGINLQYQLFDSLYIQTEFNYKEIYFSDSGDQDNHIWLFEIPVLFKLLKQFENHRFGMYMGPAFFIVTREYGLFNNEYDPADFTDVAPRDKDVEMIMGLEYGYKKDRHIYTAGLRITSMNILEYTFFDTQDAQEYSQIMSSTTFELLLGYGYNFGGTGKITAENEEDKWIFPADAGLMFNLGGSDNNTNIYISGGFLRKFTKNMYWGIKGFVFGEGSKHLLYHLQFLKILTN